MRRLSTVTLLLTIAAALALGWAAYSLFRADADAALAKQARAQANALEMSLAHAREITGLMVNLCLQREQTRRLLASWPAADDTERARIGAVLGAELARVKDLPAGDAIVSVQFFSPAGEPMARSHAAAGAQRRISATNPIVARALETARATEGLVLDTSTPTYQFAYPLTTDGQVLGVADLQIEAGLLPGLRHHHPFAPAATTRLLLPRSAPSSAPDPQGAGRTDIELGQGATSPQGASGDPDEWIAALHRSLAADPHLADAMARGERYSRRICLKPLRCYLATLHPLPTLTDPPAAYLAAYASDETHPDRLARAVLIFSIGSLLILSGAAVLRRLLASREQMRIIGEHMAEGLYVTDREGRTLYANRAAAELLGLPKATLIGCDAHVQFHQHPGAATRVSTQGCPILAETLAGEVYRSDDAVFRRGDGTLLQVSAVASPLRERGKVSGSIVLFRDISEEYQARIRLRQTETAFSNLAEGVMVTDADRKIRAINAAFTAITGYREAEVIGQNPRIFASGRHDTTFYRAMWTQIYDDDTWEGEIWNRRKDGEIYPQWLRITAVRDEQGQVFSYVGVCSDITERRAKEARLRDLAYQDQLTGLFNRTAFMEILARAVDRARERGSGLALLYLDIDRFKRINETLGHLVGDRMLLEVAARVRRALRRHDDMARIGGDELAILLEDVDQPETIERIAGNLLTVIREPMSIQETELHVTASIGVARYPSDGDDPTTLLKSADSAMYLVKRQGRDGCHLFTASLAVDASRRFALESSLRRALSEDQFRLYYQPKLSLADGSLLGFEALIRWQHPELGLLGPGQFLDEAREAGLMQGINRWVVHSAAHQRAHWRKIGLPVGRIACNLDALVFHPRALQAMLTQIVRDAGITPADLELEIVETAMRPSEATLALWNDLVGAGFDLAIDDFGTGESSLGRLKQLPFSTLKIDRSFVRDIETDDNDRSIVRTIVAMTETLGKQSIAEGVETEAQLRFLIEVGCDAIQGYLISRPMPVDEVATFMENDRSRQRIARLRADIDAASMQRQGAKGGE